MYDGPRVLSTEPPLTPAHAGGARFISAFCADGQHGLRVDPTGRITHLRAGGWAEKVGIREGDEIEELNGAPFSLQQFVHLVSAIKTDRESRVSSEGSEEGVSFRFRVYEAPRDLGPDPEDHHGLLQPLRHGSLNPSPGQLAVSVQAAPLSSRRLPVVRTANLYDCSYSLTPRDDEKTPPIAPAYAAFFDQDGTPVPISRGSSKPADYLLSPRDYSEATRGSKTLHAAAAKHLLYKDLSKDHALELPLDDDTIPHGSTLEFANLASPRIDFSPQLNNPEPPVLHPSLATPQFTESALNHALSPRARKLQFYNVPSSSLTGSRDAFRVRQSADKSGRVSVGRHDSIQAPERKLLLDQETRAKQGEVREARLVNRFSGAGAEPWKIGTGAGVGVDLRLWGGVMESSRRNSASSAPSPGLENAKEDAKTSITRAAGFRPGKKDMGGRVGAIHDALSRSRSPQQAKNDFFSGLERDLPMMRKIEAKPLHVLPEKPHAGAVTSTGPIHEPYVPKFEPQHVRPRSLMSPLQSENSGSLSPARLRGFGDGENHYHKLRVRAAQAAAAHETGLDGVENSGVRVVQALAVESQNRFYSEFEKVVESVEQGKLALRKRLDALKETSGKSIANAAGFVKEHAEKSAEWEREVFERERREMREREEGVRMMNEDMEMRRMMAHEGEQKKKWEELEKKYEKRWEALEKKYAAEIDSKRSRDSSKSAAAESFKRSKGESNKSDACDAFCELPLGPGEVALVNSKASADEERKGPENKNSRQSSDQQQQRRPSYVPPPDLPFAPLKLASISHAIRSRAPSPQRPLLPGETLHIAKALLGPPPPTHSVAHAHATDVTLVLSPDGQPLSPRLHNAINRRPSPHVTVGNQTIQLIPDLPIPGHGGVLKFNAMKSNFGGRAIPLPPSASAKGEIEIGETNAETKKEHVELERGRRQSTASSSSSTSMKPTEIANRLRQASLSPLRSGNLSPTPIGFSARPTAVKIGAFATTVNTVVVDGSEGQEHLRKNDSRVEERIRVGGPVSVNSPRVMAGKERINDMHVVEQHRESAAVSHRERMNADVTMALQERMTIMTSSAEQTRIPVTEAAPPGQDGRGNLLLSKPLAGLVMPDANQLVRSPVGVPPRGPSPAPSNLKIYTGLRTELVPAKQPALSQQSIQLKSGATSSPVGGANVVSLRRNSENEATVERRTTVVRNSTLESQQKALADKSQAAVNANMGILRPSGIKSPVLNVSAVDSKRNLMGGSLLAGGINGGKPLNLRGLQPSPIAMRSVSPVPGLGNSPSGMKNRASTRYSGGAAAVQVPAKKDVKEEAQGSEKVVTSRRTSNASAPKSRRGSGESLSAALAEVSAPKQLADEPAAVAVSSQPLSTASKASAAVPKAKAAAAPKAASKDSAAAPKAKAAPAPAKAAPAPAKAAPAPAKAAPAPAKAAPAPAKAAPAPAKAAPAPAKAAAAVPKAASKESAAAAPKAKAAAAPKAASKESAAPKAKAAPAKAKAKAGGAALFFPESTIHMSSDSAQISSYELHAEQTFKPASRRSSPRKSLPGWEPKTALPSFTAASPAVPVSEKIDGVWEPKPMVPRYYGTRGGNNSTSEAVAHSSVKTSGRDRSRSPARNLQQGTAEVDSKVDVLCQPPPQLPSNVQMFDIFTADSASARGSSALTPWDAMTTPGQTKQTAVADEEPQMSVRLVSRDIYPVSNAGEGEDDGALVSGRASEVANNYDISTLPLPQASTQVGAQEDVMAQQTDRTATVEEIIVRAAVDSADKSERRRSASPSRPSFKLELPKPAWNTDRVFSVSPPKIPPLSTPTVKDAVEAAAKKDESQRKQKRKTRKAQTPVMTSSPQRRPASGVAKKTTPAPSALSWNSRHAQAPQSTSSTATAPSPGSGAPKSRVTSLMVSKVCRNNLGIGTLAATSPDKLL